MTSITLAHAHAALTLALTHPKNPAVLRLPEAERIVEGLAKAYLARWTAWTTRNGHAAQLTTVEALVSAQAEYLADFTDPSTVGVMKVLLALALGFDPGVGALHPSWTRDDERGWWTLWSGPGSLDLKDFTPRTFPTIAAETDPIQALSLALLHVLGQQ